MDFIDEYINSKQLSASPKTVETHKHALRMFERTVGKPLNEVKQELKDDLEMHNIDRDYYSKKMKFVNTLLSEKGVK